MQGFYKRAKAQEEDLDIFFNIGLKARGLNDDGTFYVPHIFWESGDSVSIALPVKTAGRSMEEIMATRAYENVGKFAAMENISEVQVFEYTSKVVDLANQLKIGRIHGTPRLGRFIIFFVSDKDEVVYCPDTSKVYTSYRKAFFRTARKLDEKWYYKRSQ